jgi:hypothetical protein
MSNLVQRVIFGAALFVAQPSWADDIPFAADALRTLTIDAEAVIRATQPRRLASDSTDDPSRANYAVYSVKVDNVLKGDLSSGDEIRVALSEGFNVKRVSDLDNAILFLRRLSVESLTQSNIPSGSDVYIVISGRYGAVDARPDNRQEAVQDYIDSTRQEAVRGERVLSWTEKHIHSPDPFLQKSAMVDLYYERSNARALAQLGDVVRSPHASTDAKNFAIRSLQASGSASAVQPLREIAEDPTAQSTLRESAVKAFQTLPGGIEQLREWSNRGDRIVSPAAAAAIRNLPDHN